LFKYNTKNKKMGGWIFATDGPVMVGARMALPLEILIDVSKIMQKTQDEKMV
jgi:hypothetical protein